MNLHVRDVPDEVHALLAERAAAQGMSLRRYVIEVLAGHCALPTMDDWLDELNELPVPREGASGASAVAESRAADDDEILAKLPRRR